MLGKILDVSSNQHGTGQPIDWVQVKAAGVTTVFIKATEGVGYTNPYYAGDLAGARAVGLDCAAYHFAKFGDIAAEANYFISVAGTDAKILDVETSTDAAWMQTFINLLPPGHMTYGSRTLPRNLAGVLLWVADPDGQPDFGDCWQYTSTATIPGIDGNVDVSQWIGTQAAYDAFFGRTNLQVKGRKMICNDPATPGGSWTVGPDGHVEAWGGAPYLGGANDGGHPGNSWNLAAVGDVVGISETLDRNGQWGYVIDVYRHQPYNGTFSALYGPFPRDGSLKP